MKVFTVKKADLDGFTERFKESLPQKKERAVVIGLIGNLGAGKTALVGRLAHALGIIGPITSPTFVIEKRYPIDSESVRFRTLIHIDAYRLDNGDDLKLLNFEEDLDNPENLIVIEWPERVESILPLEFETLSFDVLDSDTREITRNVHKNQTKK